jgi:hypothetical protein
MATFVFVLWACRALISDYFPTVDELALEAASTPVGGAIDPSLWMTEGFHFYFHAYPEWEILKTDFFRPLANALFWMDYQVFGTLWSNQLVIGYLWHAVAVGLTGIIALRVFRLEGWMAGIAMLVSALNPAFWSTNSSYYPLPELAQYPIYQTEILCAVLMLAAFLAFVGGRFVLFCAIATVALFLKETALTLPVAAVVMAGVWWRPRPLRAAMNLMLLVLPLLIWYVARTELLRYHDSVYVTVSATRWGWILRPLRNFLFMPTTLYLGPLADTRAAWHEHAYGRLLLHSFQLAANAAWWFALAFAFLRAAVKYGAQWFGKTPQPWVSGLVFAAGNVGLVMLLQNMEPRFAYFWFALGPAAVFAALPRTRAAAAAVVLLGASLAVPQALSIPRSLSDDSIWGYRVVKQSARQLTTLLGSLDPGVRTVYLVDDVVAQTSSPEYLAKFSGFHGKLVLVNSIEPGLGCQGLKDEPGRYRLEGDAAAARLDYTAPTCFFQPWNVAPLSLYDAHKELKRGPWMNYEFPELHALGGASVTAAPEYDIGRHWSVTVGDPECVRPGSCVWLGFDPVKRAYHVLQ